MQKQLELLSQLTALLLGANAAVPVVFGTITAISSIIKGVTGTGPSLAQLADLVQAQLKANDDFGKAEIERLKAMVETAH